MLKPTVYVGQRGRALTCIANPTAPVCAGTASAAQKNPATAGAEGIARWNVMAKMICKMRATFAQTYPDCVQGTKGGALTAWSAPGTSKTNGTAEQKDSWALRAAADWAPLTQALEVQHIASDVLYCATLQPATACKPVANPANSANHLANANAFKAEVTKRKLVSTWPANSLTRYIPATAPLALFVDAHGALCTNLTGKVLTAPVARPSYAARAFMATVKAAKFIDATAATSGTASTLKVNTKLALTHLPAATFNKLVPTLYRSARSAVSGASGQEAAPALTLDGFLSAVNAAPAFCGTAGSGKFRGVPLTAMCARELAGFFAAAVAQTGARDHAGATAASGTTAVPTTTAYWQQGFKHLGDPICRGAAGAASWGGTVAAGTAGGLLATNAGGLARCKLTIPSAGAFKAATGFMCHAADGKCKAASTATWYGARGALGTEGVERTYWFSLLAQTQVAATRAAGPPLNTGVSAIADPTKL